MTHAARMKAEQAERDTKASIIILILGFAVFLMLLFGVFICLRQYALFNEYKEKHVRLETVDSARTNKTDNEK